MKRQAIVMNDKDNVATAVTELQQGSTALVDTGTDVVQIVVKEHIPLGHKFALRNISNREDIIKYGSVIGRAIQDIPEGMHVHVHNVESLRGRGDIENNEVTAHE